MNYGLPTSSKTLSGSWPEAPANPRVGPTAGEVFRGSAAGGGLAFSGVCDMVCEWQRMS